MRLSEYISELQKSLDTHGNIEVMQDMGRGEYGVYQKIDSAHQVYFYDDNAESINDPKDYQKFMVLSDNVGGY